MCKLGLPEEVVRSWDWVSDGRAPGLQLRYGLSDAGAASSAAGSERNSSRFEVHPEGWPGEK